MFQLNVRTTFVISLQDQTVENVLGLKDSCAHDIQKAFSSTNSSELTSILAIQGSTQCGSGIYVPSAGTPVTYYDCSGHRKLHTVSGRRSCCKLIDLSERGANYFIYSLHFSEGLLNQSFLP